MSRKRDPKTKEQVLDRMLSYDFDGDIRHLGAEPATIQRTGPNSMLLKFPDSGTVFELSVHRPREFAKPKPETRSFSDHHETPSAADDPHSPKPRRRKSNENQNVNH